MPSLAEMGPFYFHFEFMRAVQFAENARIALAITLYNKRRAISEPYVVADKLRARDTGGQISPPPSPQKCHPGFGMWPCPTGDQNKIVAASSEHNTVQG